MKKDWKRIEKGLKKEGREEVIWSFFSWLEITQIYFGFYFVLDVMIFCAVVDIVHSIKNRNITILGFMGFRFLGIGVSILDGEYFANMDWLLLICIYIFILFWSDIKVIIIGFHAHIKLLIYDLWHWDSSISDVYGYIRTGFPRILASLI